MLSFEEMVVCSERLKLFYKLWLIQKPKNTIIVGILVVQQTASCRFATVQLCKNTRFCKCCLKTFWQPSIQHPEINVAKKMADGKMTEALLFDRKSLPNTLKGRSCGLTVKKKAIPVCFFLFFHNNDSESCKLHLCHQC